MTKRELAGCIIIPNAFVKLYRNWIINEVARAMTKGEHTYVRMGQTLYPSTTVLCEGLISENLPVRKSYFNSNIIARLLRPFSTDYFEADVDRSTCLHATSSRREN